MSEQTKASVAIRFSYAFDQICDREVPELIDAIVAHVKDELVAQAQKGEVWTSKEPEEEQTDIDQIDSLHQSMRNTLEKLDHLMNKLWADRKDQEANENSCTNLKIRIANLERENNKLRESELNLRADLTKKSLLLNEFRRTSK